MTKLAPTTTSPASVWAGSPSSSSTVPSRRRRGGPSSPPALHQRFVVGPQGPHGALVGGVADEVPVVAEALAVQAPFQHEPFRLEGLYPPLVALVHLRVVGEEEPGRADRADRLLQHAAVEGGGAGELGGGDVLGGLVDPERLEDEDLDLRGEEGGGEHHRGAAPREDLLR